jgi:ABC-type Mn2+/Zn2+ transport system ATPase subunit
MLLYKTTYQTEIKKIVETHIKWHGSAKDAGSHRKKSRQKYGYVPNSIQSAKIVVPTSKKDLIKFLNSNLVLNKY